MNLDSFKADNDFDEKDLKKMISLYSVSGKETMMPLIRHYLNLKKEEGNLNFINFEDINGEDYGYYLYILARIASTTDKKYKMDYIHDVERRFNIHNPKIYYNLLNSIEEYLWNELLTLYRN